MRALLLFICLAAAVQACFANPEGRTIVEQLLAVRGKLLEQGPALTQADVSAALSKVDAIVAALDSRPDWKPGHPDWDHVRRVINDDLTRYISESGPKIAAEAHGITQAYWERLVNRYIETFSTADLEALLAFYRSDAGKAWVIFNDVLLESIQHPAGAARTAPQAEFRERTLRLLNATDLAGVARRVPILADMRAAIFGRRAPAALVQIVENPKALPSVEAEGEILRFLDSPLGRREAGVLIEETARYLNDPALLRLFQNALQVLSTFATKWSALRPSSADAALPGRTVNVEPQGEFASIDVRLANEAIHTLKSADQAAKDRLRRDIEKSPSRYAPPVFYALAIDLHRAGATKDAVFWLSAGRLRARVDANRCADVSARQAVGALEVGVPPELAKAVLAEPDLLALVDKVLAWDASTPYAYDHRWINLHGMQAMMSALDPAKQDAKPQLSLPRESWPALMAKTRADFRKSAERHVAAIAAKQDTAVSRTTANDACGFGEAKLPEDFTLLAAGNYSGRALDFQIDSSGHQATRMDVSVHSPGKAVALMLGAYEPTIWNIRWSSASNIVAVLVGGYHRQAVAGLPRDVPVVNSSYENRGPCGYFFVAQSELAKLNPLGRRVFGRNVDRVYLAKNGAVDVGEKAPDDVAWRFSPEVTAESFYDRNAPLAGPTGLADAVKRGVLRPATREDAEAWLKALADANPNPDMPPVAGGVRPRGPSLYNAYVVLKAFSYPAGLYGGHSATFFVPKGVPTPSGNPGHSAVYNFNSQKCVGAMCAASR